MDEYRSGYFFTPEFVGDNSWNGYEHNVLFECQDEPGNFIEAGRALGCDGVEDGRGVAVADLNDDGLLDIVVNNNNAPPSLFINQLTNAGDSIKLRLIGAEQINRDAIGTRMEIVVRGASGQTRRLTRWVEAGSGYASQSDGRLHFGLGPSATIQAAQIIWPDGEQQELDPVQLSRSINGAATIRQGDVLSF